MFDLTLSRFSGQHRKVHESRIIPLPWLKDVSLYTVLLQVIPVFRDIKNLSLYLNKAVIFLFLVSICIGVI